MNIKFITKVLVLVVMLSSQSYGFWGNDNIDIVKNGKLQLNENITLGEAFENHKGFTAVTWHKDKTKTGQDVIFAKCKLPESTVKSLGWSGDSFFHYYFTMNGDDFTLTEVWALHNGTGVMNGGAKYPGSLEARMKEIYSGKL
jgi:hypothetical protein